MNERLKTAFWLLFYSSAAGLMLTVFSLIEDLFRYLFALLALYIGILFFRKFEKLSLRITFFVLAIIIYLLFAVIASAFIFLRDNPDVLTGA
ncbi:hypothetical protein [Paenibacillus sinopodophylli]|uniref:hypothetical protein n=1 Tax=Paenibacillus sinopodophylli TaxID=1837342 RepID=UPI00110CB8EB|nr:hypothetical protein [Paenibacillus sinopodophylli]